MGEYNVYLEIKVTSPDTEKNLNDRFEFKVGDVICINDEKKVIVKKGKNSFDCHKCIFRGGPLRFGVQEKLVLCDAFACDSCDRKDNKPVYFMEVEE